jgi:hypothetical protein
MNAILIRIGIDHAYGGWNAPVDPVSRRFVYVPIPERQEPLKDLVRLYDEIVPALASFSSDLHLTDDLMWTLPANLPGRPMHLDPDFEHLTYGDNGANRGAKLKRFSDGDLLVFYAGLRAVSDSKRLMYALVGLFVAEEVLEAIQVPKELWHKNAHTRKRKIGGPDIIVRAKRGKSGRLNEQFRLASGGTEHIGSQTSCWLIGAALMLRTGLSSAAFPHRLFSNRKGSTSGF